MAWTEQDGARLRQWREERGLPRGRVAAALGISERTLVRWEQGKGKARPGDLEWLTRRFPPPTEAA